MVAILKTAHRLRHARPKKHTPLRQVSVMGARYCSPKFGRWISRDPIGEGPDPNLYRFVRNSPIGDLDIRGLSTFSGQLYTVTVDDQPFWISDANYFALGPWSLGSAGCYGPDRSERDVDLSWVWSGCNCYQNTDGRIWGMLLQTQARQYRYMKGRETLRHKPEYADTPKHEAAHMKNHQEYWRSYEGVVLEMMNLCVCEYCIRDIDHYLRFKELEFRWQKKAADCVIDRADGQDCPLDYYRSKSDELRENAKKRREEKPECYR
jgi:RHS repeat-associated protein